MRVRKVKASGLVDIWNKQSSQYEVKHADEIEEVNGKRGNPNILLQTIAMDQALVIRLHRPSTSEIASEIV